MPRRPYRLMRNLGFDRNFRNDYNANLKDIETDVIEQKSRIDAQLQKVEQPSEIVDNYVDSQGVIHDTLRDRMQADEDRFNILVTELRELVVGNRQNADGRFDDILKALNTKSSTAYVDQIAAQLSHGGPNETFNSLAALFEMYPYGAPGQKLVHDTQFRDGGHSFIWRNNEWMDLGVYQAFVIADASVTAAKLVDNAAIYKKRSRLGEWGYIGGARPATANLISRSLMLSPVGTEHRVMYGNEYYVIPTNTEVSLQYLDSDLSVLWFDTRTKTFATLPSLGIDQINENMVFLGSINLGEATKSFINGHVIYRGQAIPTKEVVTYMADEPIHYRVYGNSGEVRWAESTPTRLWAGGKVFELPYGVGKNFIILNAEQRSYPTALFVFNIRTKAVTYRHFEYTLSDEEVIVGIIKVTGTSRVISNGPAWFNREDSIHKSGREHVLEISDLPVQIDMLAKKVIFAAARGLNTRMFVNGDIYAVAPENAEVDLSTTGSNLNKVIFNYKTLKFRAERWNGDGLFQTECLVGLVRTNQRYAVTWMGEYELLNAGTQTGNPFEIPNIPADIDTTLSFDMQNAMQSWWTKNLLKHYNGMRNRNYIGYCDNDGFNGVISHDLDTSVIIKKQLSKPGVNDHNATAVDVLPNGHIIAVYPPGHNTGPSLRARVSKKREDVREFHDEVVIDMQHQNTTYVQLHQYNGKVFAHTRLDNNWWAYVTTTDGFNWTTRRRWLSAGMQYYVLFVKTTDPKILRALMYSNPNNSTDTNIRECFFNMETEEFFLLDGTVITGNNIDHTRFPIIIPLVEGERQRLLDVAITPMDECHVLYATFTDATDQQYKVGVYKDEELEITDITNSGMAFFTRSIYVNGACFGKDYTTLFIAREQDNVWRLEEWKLGAEGYVFVKEVDRGIEGMRIVRPEYVKGSDMVYWKKGYFNLEDFTDFETDLKFAK